MQDRKVIVASAIGYSAFFTLFMIWWTTSREWPEIGMLALAGACNGLVWYWLFSSGTRWVVARRKQVARPRL